MGQEAGVSWANVDIDLSTDNFSTAIAVEGAANVITLSGGERATGEEYTADGDVAIIGFGKRAPVDVTLRLIYQEVNNKGSELLLTSYDTLGGGGLNIRWFPLGRTATKRVYTTTGGKVTGGVFPTGNLVDGVPIVVEATIHAIVVTKSVYAG